VDARPVGLDVLIGGAAAHPDHDGAGQDGVGEFAEPGQRDGGEGGEFYDGLLGAFADAPVGDAGAAVPGVEQAAQFLVFFGLGAEDGALIRVMPLVWTCRCECVRGGVLSWWRQLVSAGGASARHTVVAAPHECPATLGMRM